MNILFKTLLSSVKPMILNNIDKVEQSLIADCEAIERQENETEVVLILRIRPKEADKKHIVGYLAAITYETLNTVRQIPIEIKGKQHNSIAIKNYVINFLNSSDDELN